MTRPMLQVALDVLSLREALRVADLAAPWVDWIEAGTPLVVAEGLAAVRALRARFLTHPLVADLKVADAAKMLATAAFASGADVLTVLSAADDHTIEACVRVAHASGRQVLGDHLARDVSTEALDRLARLGVDYVGIHLPKDAASRASIDLASGLAASSPVPVVLAGGVDAALLHRLRRAPLGAVIVGGAIVGAADPASAARDLAELLRTWDPA